MSTVVRALRQYLQPREAGYTVVELASDEQKQDWTDPPSPPSPVVVRRALLVALAVAALLSLPLQAYAVLKSPTAHLQPQPAAPARKVVIRTVRDNGSGIGSVVHQLSRATVFADAIGAELYAPESGLVRHGYDTVSVLNTFRKTRMDGVDFGRVCTLSHYMVSASNPAGPHGAAGLFEATLASAECRILPGLYRRRVQGYDAWPRDQQRGPRRPGRREPDGRLWCDSQRHALGV